MQKILLITLVSSLLVCASCNAQKYEYSGVLFYNVENLFDTINNPDKLDDEFTPGSEKQWNTDRYLEKIDHLGRVIQSADEELPILIGLCEIENASVLIDLAKSKRLSDGNYAPVHFDSPDERGIDCALLYNKSEFTPTNSRAVKVNLPQDNGGTTRDILFVEGDLKINSKREKLFLFVNHWPSRVEGAELTASRRAIAAATLKHLTDSLNQLYADPNIIIMGDFNDTPFDISIQRTLGAVEKAGTRPDECLVNQMSDFQKYNSGTYNYKGNWQCLDQFITSESFHDLQKIEIKSVMIIKQDFMLYHSEKYGDSPNKTYSGTKYHAGYSDHLPIYMQIIFL